MSVRILVLSGLRDRPIRAEHDREFTAALKIDPTRVTIASAACIVRDVLLSMERITRKRVFYHPIPDPRTPWLGVWTWEYALTESGRRELDASLRVQTSA